VTSNADWGAPDCQGRDARFTSQRQADYVADQLREEFGTDWLALAHGDHWHVTELAPTDGSGTP
jgi:hypothetical protein